MIHTLFRHALKRNRLVFFQNPDDLELFVSRRIVPRNQTHRIFGSGVDTRRFVPRIPREPQDNTVFLMISRLICAKGVLEYIEAARILKHEARPAKFRLLGPFDKHPTAVDPAAVSTATRSGVIEYCGTTDDVRPYIRDADVFVLPSYYGEGTPRSSLEAMAMGKPIVTTDSPGCRETVVQGRNGYLVPIRDPIALANAMRELIGNRERIQSMGLRSRGIAEDLYDVQKVNSDLWREISRTLK
jgi:glycosyltransferase involved in cell wall biosynthesis